MNLMRPFLALISVVTHTLFAQTNTENRVNEHLSKTHKKIEIERQKREAELLKENANIQIDPVATPPKRKGFVEKYPTEPKPKDNVIPDHFNHYGSDPAQEIQRDVSETQESELQRKREQEAFIQEFKRRARESGIEVEVDPNTLEARPKN